MKNLKENIQKNLLLLILLMSVSTISCSKKLEVSMNPSAQNLDEIYLVKKGMTVETDMGVIEAQVDSVLIPFEYYKDLQRR